jgi:hypothetical protein
MTKTVDARRSNVEVYANSGLAFLNGWSAAKTVWINETKRVVNT